MNAVSIIDKEVAQVVSLPEPASGLPGLLLKVEYVGLCGTDLNSFRGLNPMVTMPRIIGHEVAATVVEGTAAIPAGTHVTVNPYTHCGTCAACRNARYNACQFNQTYGVQRDGALTQYLRVPEEKVYVSDLSLQELCLVEPLTVGMHAVHRGRVTANDLVAVIGCGGVGLGAVAGAAFQGATTIAIDLDDAKLDTARAAGASHTINTARTPLHDTLQQLTDGRGPDVIIEAIGTPDTFRSAVEEVAFTGRVVYIGYAKHLVAYETKYFVQKELDILGSRNALPGDFQQVIALLKSGRFPVQQTISAVVGLEETPGILKQWSNATAQFTKIMVNVGQS